MSPEVKTPPAGVFWRGQMRGDSGHGKGRREKRGPGQAQVLGCACAVSNTHGLGVAKRTWKTFLFSNLLPIYLF